MDWQKKRGTVIGMAEIIHRELFNENGEVVGYEYGGRLVRCGDCKYWNTDWEPNRFNPDNPTHFCDINDLFPTGDWFCKDGQRREEVAAND